MANLHFPGFSKEAAEFLVKQRDIAAIGVDTASIDYGPSTDFIVHRIINGADKPGFENVANLDRLPAKGATVIALPHEDHRRQRAVRRASSLCYRERRMRQPCAVDLLCRRNRLPSVTGGPGRERDREATPPGALRKKSNSWFRSAWGNRTTSPVSSPTGRGPKMRGLEILDQLTVDVLHCVAPTLAPRAFIPRRRARSDRGRVFGSCYAPARLVVYSSASCSTL